MASLNKVLLMGNLTRPPELHYTPKSGEKRDETAFLTVIAWGKTAENCSEYLDKGSQVLVEGRIQTRDWEGKDGQKRSATEIVAERVQFLSRLKSGAGGPAAPAPVGA